MMRVLLIATFACALRLCGAETKKTVEQIVADLNHKEFALDIASNQVLTGQVLAVKERLMMINLGAQNGVRANMRFELLAINDMKLFARIDKVFYDMSSVKIEVATNDGTKK